jgi:hypothetical protein
MPRSPQTRWVAALVALLVFLLAAWLFGSAITSLSDGERTMLRVGLVVLGLLFAAALLWYLRPARGLEPVPPARPPATRRWPPSRPRAGGSAAAGWTRDRSCSWLAPPGAARPPW